MRMGERSYKVDKLISHTHSLAQVVPLCEACPANAGLHFDLTQDRSRPLRAMGQRSEDRTQKAGECEKVKVKGALRIAHEAVGIGN